MYMRPGFFGWVLNEIRVCQSLRIACSINTSHRASNESKEESCETPISACRVWQRSGCARITMSGLSFRPQAKWDQEICPTEKERPMSNRRMGRRRSTVALRTSGRRRLVAIVLLLSLVSAGAILGQRLGAFPQASRKKPTALHQDGAAITPASFDSPSK